MSVWKTRFVLAGVAMALPVAAQTIPPNDDQARASPSKVEIEAIIVTARRVGEKLQETPVAVTALSAEALADKSVVNVVDIGRLAPGLNIRPGGGSQTQGYMFIRGVGQNNDNPSLESGVGIYVDDIYMPRSQGGLFDLSDVAQVEVLRGPQGTLYGKNTLGGAIKVTSHAPGPDPERMISARVGSFNETKLAFAINQPLIDDKLFVRGSGTIRRRDGYSDNLFDGRELNDISSTAQRLMLRYAPTTAVDLQLSVDRYQDRALESPARLVAINQTPVLGLIEAQVGPLSPYVLSPGGDPDHGGGSDVRYDGEIGLPPMLDSFGTSLHGTWTNGDTTLRSITAYRSLESVRLLDVDSTALRVLHIGDQTQQDQFSQELQIGGALGDSLDYLLGVFYYDEDINHDFRQVIPAIGVASGRLNEIGTESFAGYLSLTWNVTDRLDATAGGRYTREKRSLATTIGTPDRSLVFVGPFGRSKVFTDFSPKAEVSFKWNQDIFSYVSVSKGFKSGGFNNDAASSFGLEPYDPETVRSYELGLKTQLFDRRLTFNVAAFRSDYDDLQFTVFDIVNGELIPVIRNAASAKIDGIEIEANVRPLSDLQLFANFAYNDGRYDRFTHQGLGDLSSLDLAHLAKYSYLVGFQYEASLTGGTTARLSADYSWRSEASGDVENTAALQQPDYGLLNARATLVLLNGMEIAAYGKNLTDERIIQIGAQALASLGFAWGFFNEPRNYGVEATWRF